jgi:hypothetical protein
MSTSQTTEALAAITDEGLFERLAAAVLRAATPMYRALVHPGINAAGKTVKSPLDGICFVPGSTPPHLVAVHHTTTARDGLEKKWLHDPSKVKHRNGTRTSDLPGDVRKTAQVVIAERERTLDLVATLVLTTNQEPDEELVRDVEHTARSLGLSVDLWARSRIAHFLDNDPSGQWLRSSYLGIEQQQLSPELLHCLSKRNLEIHRPHDDPSTWVPRQLDTALAGTRRSDVSFLVASSGMGKSVACYRMLSAHVHAGGFGLVLPHDAVASALTVEQAVAATLTQLHPPLASAGPAALTYCSPEMPLLLVVEDINRAGQTQALLEKVAGWSRTNDRGRQDCAWQLLCPLWPEVLAFLPEQVRKRVEPLLTFAGPFAASEGRDAVLARARAGGTQVPSSLSAEALSTALGHDPLLIALHDYSSPPDPLRIIGTFVEGALSRAALVAREYSAGDFRKALRALVQAMLSHRQVEPIWGNITDWLGGDGVALRLLARLAHDGVLIRLLGDSHAQRISFRHDRVRDWLLADGLIDSAHRNQLSDDVLAEPFFADVVGASLALGDMGPEYLERVRALTPLAMFYALRLFGRANKRAPTTLSAAIQQWLQDPVARARSHLQLRYAALGILADTDSPDVPTIADRFHERTLAHHVARLRNGDFSGGVDLCMSIEPGVQAPWRDAQLEHATSRYGPTLARDLGLFLGRRPTEVPAIQGALRLAGHLADPSLADAIGICWASDQERSRSISDYLWALSHCCGDDPARRLGPVVDAWAALPDTEEDRTHVSARWSVAEYHLRWAFRRWLPERALPYFIERAAEEALQSPITHLLHGLDHVAAITFVVHELANTRRRVEGTNSFSPFVASADDEWRRAQKDGRPMSPASRAALAAMWTNDENDKFVRAQAFSFWAATQQTSDLDLLRAEQRPGALDNAILRARLVRGDTTAIPALVQHLNNDVRGHWWWQYVRYVWSEELVDVLDQALTSRGLTAPRVWGEHVEADWHTHEVLQRLPRDQAERLLTNHWDHLRFAPHFVQTAFFVGTPQLVQLGKDAVSECPTPGVLFTHLSHRYGHRIEGHPRVTREEQIRVLAPYLNLLADIDRAALWDECNDHGWFATRGELLDAVQSREFRNRAWDREFAFAEFDRLATDKKQRAFVDLVADGFTKTGVPWPEVVAMLTEWLAARQTVSALRVVGAVLVHGGSRKDLSALDSYLGARTSETEAIVANTQFVVRRRSLQ